MKKHFKDHFRKYLLILVLIASCNEFRKANFGDNGQIKEKSKESVESAPITSFDINQHPEEVSIKIGENPENPVQTLSLAVKKLQACISAGLPADCRSEKDFLNNYVTRHKEDLSK